MRINLWIVLTLLCSVAYGQTSNTTKDKETKWEIGLDLLPLIRDTSFHMKEAIFIKRKLNENTKLRGRFGIYFNDVKNYPTHFPRTDTVWGHRPRLYFAFGIEKLCFSSSKINISYGADAFLFFRRNKLKNHTDTRGFAVPPIERVILIDDIEHKTGINFFVNFEYLLTRNLALNIESFWQFAYRRERYFSEEYWFSNLASTDGSTINRFLTQFQPISSINLIYKF